MRARASEVRTGKGLLVSLHKVTAEHAAAHDDEVGKQPRDWRADRSRARTAAQHYHDHRHQNDTRVDDYDNIHEYDPITTAKATPKSLNDNERGLLKNYMTGSNMDKVTKASIGWGTDTKCDYCGAPQCTTHHLIWECTHFEDTRAASAPAIALRRAASWRPALVRSHERPQRTRAACAQPSASQLL